MKTLSKAKPFIKWVGGKGQLIEQLDAQLPANFSDWDDVTYIEPFVGGGAMLFYMLQQYPNIHHAVINDVNPDLTTCYHTVRNMPEQLITSLMEIQDAYNALETEEGRKDFFLAVRDRYNEAGFRFMLSNSDCKGKNEEDNFFDVLYGTYTRTRIYEQNGTPNIVIRNYSKSDSIGFSTIK